MCRGRGANVGETSFQDECDWNGQCWDCMFTATYFVTSAHPRSLQNVLLQHTIVIFTISTTGQGEFPRNARNFWKSLLRKKLPPGCLGRMKFTTFGLGDSSYSKWLISISQTHRRLIVIGSTGLRGNYISGWNSLVGRRSIHEVKRMINMKMG